MRVICLIPVYNNASTIGEIVGKCRGQGLAVVAVNDGSTDASAEASRKAGAIVLDFEKNRGKGAALIAGFSYLLREYPDVDLVVTLDADGQHDPADIPRLLEAASDGRSFVIGSRVEDLHEMPSVRRIANGAVSGLISLLLGQRIADTQSGFRAFPMQLVKERKFSQVRYGIETEMLFAAKAAGFAIREVPIKNVYFSKIPVSLRKDLVNFFDILGILFIKGLPVFGRERRMATGFFMAAILAVFFVWQFNFAVRPLERALERGVPIFSKLAPGKGTQEALAVFEWLRTNTPPDAIIFAPRFQGHRIMALADRRVVVSSKVYPSESADIARRERDTARFFFATDNDEAIRILQKYGASYVLVPRSRDWFDFCREISVCQWVNVYRNDAAMTFSAGDLTPEGAQRTLAGKLLGKAEVPFLRKVWDSPSYLVYRVAEASAPAQCEFTDKQREAIFDFLRRGAPAEEEALDRRCGVSLAVWADGVQRYAGVAEGRSIRGGVSAIVSDFLGKISNAEAVEVAVWDTQAAYPLSISNFGRQPAELDHGYRLTIDGKSAYAFPAFSPDAPLRNGADILAALCKNLGGSPRCFAVPGATLSSFPADTFVGAQGSIQQNDSGVWSDEALRLRLRSALNWILQLQRPNGLFRNFVNPSDPDLADPEPRDVALDALGSWALSEGYAAFRDPRYVLAATRGVIAVERRLQGGEPARTNALSFALMTRLRLWEATRDIRHLQMAGAHADHLKPLITQDRWVPERFLVSDGGAAAVGNDYTRIATHIALWALSRYYGALNQAVPDDVTALAEMLYTRFLTNRMVEGDLDLAETARLANGFRAFAEASDDARFGVAAQQVGRWLTEFQYLDRPASLDGAFPENPQTASIDTNSVGRVAEGLVFAGEEFRDAARGAFRWLMQMQYTPESLYFVFPQERASLIGGLRGNLFGRTAPIGAASHFVLSGLWYLERQR